MQHVIKKAVLLVPQAKAVIAQMVHGAGNVDEVLPEFAGDILDTSGRPPQVPARWPAYRASTWPSNWCRQIARDVSAGRQKRAAIEDANVIQPQEAALKDVPAFGVFAVDPPGKVQQQLVKNAFEKCVVARAAFLALSM